MDEVTELLQEASKSVHQKVTPVTTADAKVEKKRSAPKGVKDPATGPGGSAADGDIKNVKNILESEEAPEADVAAAGEEEEAPLLVNEDELSEFDKLANRILGESYDDEEFDPEAVEGGGEEEYEEAPMEEEYPEEEYPEEEYPEEEYPEEGGTVTVSTADLDELQALLDRLRGGGEEAPIDDIPEEEIPEEEIPQESNNYKIGGVVGKKPHPLTGPDSRQTKSTKAGDPKAKKGPASKSFAPTATLKGADKPGKGHVVVKNRKSPGDPLFKC